MQNLPELFKSKRFWTAVSGIIAMIIVELVPTLADFDIAAIVLVVVSAIIGYSLEDYATARNAKPEKLDTTAR